VGAVVSRRPSCRAARHRVVRGAWLDSGVGFEPMKRMSAFLIHPLDPSIHRREDFRCESAELEAFLRTRARKEMEAVVSACFVLVPDVDRGRIAGFYTLSAAEIEVTALPEGLAKKLPRYPAMPATLLGRLARDLEFRGQGIGDRLMFNGLARAFSTSHEVGSLAVITDPKDEKATAFYRGFHFLPLKSGRMFLPMREIGQLLKQRKS